MIIKTIYHKIQIHPFFYGIAFLAFCTGNFKSFCLFMTILIIHECGHVSAGLYYHWKISKIHIYPFGALTVFQDHLNKPMKEEFWIVLMGPIFQILFYYFLIFCHKDSTLLESFHYGLLFFNLLPIIPLDGSKLFQLILQYFCSYWKSFILLWFVSIGSIFIFCIQNIKSLVWVLILLLLLEKGLNAYYRRYSIFSKFLLERTLYSFSFPRRKNIVGENVKKMKRDTYHLFYKDGHYETEQQVLKKMFDFQAKR